MKFVATKTKNGDNWQTLFQRYGKGFASVSLFTKAVVGANGVPYNTAEIEKWIFSLSQTRATYSNTDNPGLYGGPLGVGWAQFSEGNEILLPEIKTESAPIVADKKWRIVAALAAIVVVAVAVYSVKKA
jgi:hypothetical protein